MTTPTIAITGLAIGVGVLCWLLWYGARIRHNTRGHRLGRWLAFHQSTKTKN